MVLIMSKIKGTGGVNHTERAFTEFTCASYTGLLNPFRGALIEGDNHVVRLPRIG